LHGRADDALDGCERILADECSDRPERALYMIGPVSEARLDPLRA
jgi:F-type H+/Na+-transporting ATPase subunit beta